MKILLLADEEDLYLWDHYQPGRLRDVDLILSAGDLKAEYLSFIVTMARCPLLYVHGNHDTGYAQRPPEGCDCIDGKLVTVKGLRILGLGGSQLYSGGEHQYTERQMEWRIHRLWPKLHRAGGVDIILTHAPARGYGDEENVSHRGFEAFLPLMDKYRPRYLVHGHVHKSYNAGAKARHERGGTSIINAQGRTIIEI